MSSTQTVVDTRYLDDSYGTTAFRYEIDTLWNNSIISESIIADWEFIKVILPLYCISAANLHELW